MNYQKERKLATDIIKFIIKEIVQELFKIYFIYFR